MYFLLFFISFVLCSNKELFSSLQSKARSYQPQLNFIQRQLKNFITPEVSNDGDISVVCALCGIAVNEVEGFLIEDKTQEEIITELKTNFCPHLGLLMNFEMTFLQLNLIFLGTFESFCDILVGYVPTVINFIENKQNVSDVCIELNFCDKPFPRYDDPVDVPRYTMYDLIFFFLDTMFMTRSS